MIWTKLWQNCLIVQLWCLVVILSIAWGGGSNVYLSDCCSYLVYGLRFEQLYVLVAHMSWQAGQIVIQPLPSLLSIPTCRVPTWDPIAIWTLFPHRLPPHKVFPRTTQDLKENLLKNISPLLCIFEKAVVGSLKLFENSSELCLGMGGRAREQLGIKSWIRIIFVCSLPAAVLDWENKQVLLGTNRR